MLGRLKVECTWIYVNRSAWSNLEESQFWKNFNGNLPVKLLWERTRICKLGNIYFALEVLIGPWNWLDPKIRIFKFGRFPSQGQKVSLNWLLLRSWAFNIIHLANYLGNCLWNLFWLKLIINNFLPLVQVSGMLPSKLFLRISNMSRVIKVV